MFADDEYNDDPDGREPLSGWGCFFTTLLILLVCGAFWWGVYKLYTIIEGSMQ